MCLARQLFSLPVISAPVISAPAVSVQPHIVRGDIIFFVVTTQTMLCCPRLPLCMNRFEFMYRYMPYTENDDCN